MRLITYYGFVENKKILVSGRLVYGQLNAPKKNDSKLINIKNMIQQYLAIGAANKKIKITLGDDEKIIKTNKYGSFKTYFNYKKKEIKSYTATYKNETRHSAIFLPKNKQTAIISDIDDTFLVTHSASFFKRIWISATNNYNTRNSVKDIIDIYKNFSGPIFYVSNSEWRLYNVLEGFRKINNLPQGPFLLRGLSKYNRIKSIIESYPYDFILIGDDGQKDPEEYTKLHKTYPARIKGICIRNISNKKRFEKVKKILPKKSLISPEGHECLHYVKNIIDTDKQKQIKKTKK